MVAIEYSPNNRSRCQSCRSLIYQSDVRVAVKIPSPYQRGKFASQYYHGACYTNRKDFTKFYGFRNLLVEDQKKFLTEEQKRSWYPGDYSEGATKKAATGEELKSPDKITAVAGSKRKSSEASRGKENSANGNEQRKRKLSLDKKEIQITITGLAYATVQAQPGQKMRLVLDPNNPHDSNAIRVEDASNQKVGHVKRDQAASLSPFIAEHESTTDFDVTVTTPGDGYVQSARVVFVNKKKDDEKLSTPAGDAVADAGISNKASPNSRPMLAAAVLTQWSHVSGNPYAKNKRSNPYAKKTTEQMSSTVVTPPPAAKNAAR